MRLRGESDLLRQTTAAYQAVTGLLAATVPPVSPPTALRERLIIHVELEAAREAVQFERTANALAFSAVSPVQPHDVLRDRLLSRVEGESKVQLGVNESLFVQGKTKAPISDGEASRSEGRVPENAGSLSLWVRSCVESVRNVLRTMYVRSLAPRPSAHGLTFIKATEGAWLTIAPGVAAKLLSYDSISRRATSLVRIAPGTRYAPHRHAAAEELYVLEGGCLCGGRELAVGDYHRAEAGTEHHDTSSDDGCLLFAISSPQNEMLDEPRV
jgi:quercetin dioxygenase-like cupin family protein